MHGYEERTHSIVKLDKFDELKKCEIQDEQPCKHRVLVVANRLPVSAVQKGDAWQLKKSSGGLVSALSGITEIETRWIGWAGVNVPGDTERKSLTESLAQMRCVPVFLDEDLVRLYYNGYCNNIMWPLFHSRGLPQDDGLDAYMFADVIEENYQEGDVVWCHDYHLMFLPSLLKEKRPNMRVGWFLHTPFPSSEMYRTMPSRSQLLTAVLAADLVGFHTYDYARNFVSACTHILGLEGTLVGVQDQGRVTRIAAVILGVDRLDVIKGIPEKLLAFEKFLKENPNWCDKVVIVQIAVPTRTEVPMYKKLARRVHEIVGRINGRFGTLTSMPVHFLVCLFDPSSFFHVFFVKWLTFLCIFAGSIADFNTLCALYAVADVALITSVMDGMNLVSYEFVACQASKKGVLVLSEFVGAAQSLGAGAILVNPWNITDVASSILYALDMPSEEREKRHNHSFMHVITHTCQKWAETFLSELDDTVAEAQLRTKQIPPQLQTELAVDRYRCSSNRMIILGFNETLTKPVNADGMADQVKQTELNLHPELEQPLKRLCDDPASTVVIISGSQRCVLEKNFEDYNVWLAAEHGVFIRTADKNWSQNLTNNIHTDWIVSLKVVKRVKRHVFEYFTTRTPRSYCELRETSIVWSYKYSDFEFGRRQAKDLLNHLRNGPISNASVDIVQGERSVEVRVNGVSKGVGIHGILAQVIRDKDMKLPIDYVLCVGHFLPKDEDIYTLFDLELPATTAAPTHSSLGSSIDEQFPKGSEEETKADDHSVIASDMNRNMTINASNMISMLDLQGDNYLCAVGRQQSNAKYLLNSSAEVVALLKKLAA
ncbi:putative alpha,alpha-trehalose-phosphate synthase (UDP-forming) [Helianthus debilis subsp. tardiflorus]